MKITPNTVSVELTKDDFNVIINGMSYILIQNSQNSNFSKDSAKYYADIKTKFLELKHLYWE